LAVFLENGVTDYQLAVGLLAFPRSIS